MRINRDKLSEATGNKHRLEIEIEVLNANYDSLDKLRDELESELKTVKTNLNKLDEDYSKKKQSLLEIWKKATDFIKAQLPKGDHRHNSWTQLRSMADGNKFNIKLIDDAFTEIYFNAINTFNEANTRAMNHYTKAWKQTLENVQSTSDSERKKQKQFLSAYFKEQASVLKSKLNSCSSELQETAAAIKSHEDAIWKKVDTVIDEVGKSEFCAAKIEQDSAEFAKIIGELKLFDKTHIWKEVNDKINNAINASEKVTETTNKFFRYFAKQQKKLNSEQEAKVAKLEEISKEIKKCERDLNDLMEAGSESKSPVKKTSKKSSKEKIREGQAPADQPVEYSPSMSLPDVKAKIADLNRRIRQFNKQKDDYDRKLNNCMSMLRSIEGHRFVCEEKRKRLQEIQDDYKAAQKWIKNVKKEHKQNLDEIKALNVASLEYKGVTIIVRKNDLTEEKETAIVNPANENLQHDGGAARAIANKGGQVIWDESKKYITANRRLPTGKAIVTSAGNLKCRYVIHAVGPRFNKTSIDHSRSYAQMKETVESILEIQRKQNMKSISMPAISTGIFGFPIKKATLITGSTIRDCINSFHSEMEGKTIVLCNNDDDTVNSVKEFVFQPFHETNEADADSEDHEEKDNEEPVRRSKKPEPEEEEEEEEIKPKKKRCRKCGRKIRKKDHQKNGRHLDVCYVCYMEKKQKKENKRKQENDDENEEENEDEKPKKN